MKSEPFYRKRFTGAILSLCLAAATHSFLLFSFFPYAGYMAVTLLDNNNSSSSSSDTNVVTVDNVGIYAGILGAAFTLGRFLGFVPWKVVRTVLGEKNALVISLLLTGLASLWVGLATTFSGAVLARLAQGISNCISGSVKRAAINDKHNTLVSERAALSDNNEAFDTKPPEALVLSVMWWGTALGPIVGGLLSDPGFLGSFLGLDSESSDWYASYPYLLSNGFSAILCWLSMVCVAVFTTDPPHNSVSTPAGEKRPLLASSGITSIRSVGSTSSSIHSLGSTIHETPRRLWDSFWTLWRTNKDAKYHLVAYWSFSFVVVCYDEAIPLFLITSKASTGLGLSEGRVGLILSTTGLIIATSYHAVLENVFDTENGAQDGMYRVLGACAFLGSVPASLVPLSLLLNNYDDGNNDDDSNRSFLLGLTRSSFVYLVVLISFLRGSANLYFSLIGMATGRTLRVVHKDEAARIMTIGALLLRSLAPIVAGTVMSHFMAIPSPSSLTSVSTPTVALPLYSSWMAWIVIGLLFGLAAATMTFDLARQTGMEKVLPEKQREYIAKRLARMGSLASLGAELEKVYGSASRSMFARWSDCMSFRLRMSTKSGRRRSSIALTSEEHKEELTMENNQNHTATWKEHTVAPGVDFDKVSFFIIGTHEKDKACLPHVMAPPIMEALQRHLPTNCTESNYWLKYSLLRDGASKQSVEAKSGLARNTILAIETLDGDVFGCFMTTPWVRTNNRYRRSGESFLWRLKNRRSEESDGIIDVYPMTGDNDLCQLFADDKIACGGGVVGSHGDGFGILLEEDLLSGSSSPCVTYGNPCFCAGYSTSTSSIQNRFEVANIEVWGLTPYMFVADAERSEQRLRFIKDNSHASYGDTENGTHSTSSASAWSTFL